MEAGGVALVRVRATLSEAVERYVAEELPRLAVSGAAEPDAAARLVEEGSERREDAPARPQPCLPAGLEQRVGEAGWRLSDGERSRVCLARAMLQDCALLILDECLAALNPASRLEVQRPSGILEMARERSRKLDRPIAVTLFSGHGRASSPAEVAAAGYWTWKLTVSV